MHRRLLFIALLALTLLDAQEKYPLGPDSQQQSNVPKGVVTRRTWTSKVYPGTTRDYAIYVPAQYQAGKPAPVVIFQDGIGFINEQGRWRVPIVFDNLIARGDPEGRAETIARLPTGRVDRRSCLTHCGWVWSFSILPDGSLANGQRFHRLETEDESAVGPDGMTLDNQGFLYVATDLGIQISDQAGRVNDIIAKPQPGSVSNVVFGGPDLNILYAMAGDKVFRRVVRVKGFLPWIPMKPPRPQL